MPKPVFIIKFDMPQEVLNGFPRFVGTVRRHIVRQALRSALLPSRNMLKAKIMALPNISKQSSGATARALISKYRNARNNPDRFYGIIGVNNRYIEATTPTRSPLFPHAIQRQVSFGVKLKKRNEDGSPIYSKRYPRQDVRSRLRKKVYGSRKTGGIKKRWPARYLHLWEAGFTHAQSHQSFPGRHYFRSVKASTESLAQDIFRTKVLEHFYKAFGQ